MSERLHPGISWHAPRIDALKALASEHGMATQFEEWLAEDVERHNSEMDAELFGLPYRELWPS